MYTCALDGPRSKEILHIPAPVDLTELGQGICQQNIPVVDVLHLVQYLWGEHGLEVKQQDLDKFWTHAVEFEQWGPGHPGPGTMPIAAYGDEARYTDGQGLAEKIVVLTISFPLYMPRSTRNSKFLVFGMRQSLMVGDGWATIEPVLQYLSWSLNQLFFGVRPASNYLDLPLPATLQREDPGNENEPMIKDGLRFSLMELRGDWAWHLFWGRLKNRWSSTFCCFRCNAMSTKQAGYDENLLYASNYSSDGYAWREVTHVQFLNQMTKPGALCASLEITIL